MQQFYVADYGNHRKPIDELDDREVAEIDYQMGRQLLLGPWLNTD